MLAPPNSGSCVARRFRGLHFPIGTVFSRIYGKAGGCAVQPQLRQGRFWCATHIRAHPAEPTDLGTFAGGVLDSAVAVALPQHSQRVHMNTNMDMT